MSAKPIEPTAWRLRRWLIRKLAGKSTVIINATVVDGSIHTKMTDNRWHLVANCDLHAVSLWTGEKPVIVDGVMAKAPD